MQYIYENHKEDLTILVNIVLKF